MYGEHPGSPRRDDRQDFDFRTPVQTVDPFAAPPTPPTPQASPSSPHEDDVKVAGSVPRQAGAPAGDTLGFQAYSAEGLRAGAPGEAPRDELTPDHPAPTDRTGRGGPGRSGGKKVAAIAAGAVVLLGGGAVAVFALTGDSGGGDSAKIRPDRRTVADPPPPVDPKVLEEQRRRLALDRASREAREDDGKVPSLLPKGKPLPTKKPEDGGGGGNGGGGPTGDPVPAGEAQKIAKSLMPRYGFSGDGQFGCLVKLWNKESHWNVHADNPSSEAYGIPQANPGSKMASAGPDWQNNATTQIKWGLGYIKGRYKTPCGAWSHSQSVGWY
ncbi:hypothetical protein BZB76_4823 [Actinomadura pelletieri DSM 43383]|uniref:Transglycosylase-like protein with SLT domain n=1 Tax=Actinomadura pelletieri DSM 43383 TaxID=1120940 RepID=A0A495QIL9_9ACTN|nr:lytic transglycosylase domain-containing protein [Actinomadura pelletieri]RKS72012.1 hypothetical protein BZB76_4823 [Actinomadura pelletieri DSM 43383]